MSNHNQYKRISPTAQENTIVCSDDQGYITNWLENDPIISSLKQQNQFIGNVSEIPSGEDLQTYLSNFVYETVGRNPRSGDEVGILDVGELWLFTGTFGDDGEWKFFTDTNIGDASTTEKGVMKVGSGLLVSDGTVSVDSSIYTPARITISNSSTTPSLSLQANTDYTFSNNLTSLTISSVPSSSYYTTLTFTTGSTFTFSVPSNLQFFFMPNNPTLKTNTTYKLVLVNGKCHVYYIGDRTYPINKITSLNPSLTAVNNVATWTISNTLPEPTKDVFIRVYETASGNTVEVDSTATLSTITLKLYTENSTISAGVYTAVIMG